MGRRRQCFVLGGFLASTGLLLILALAGPASVVGDQRRSGPAAASRHAGSHPAAASPLLLPLGLTSLGLGGWIAWMLLASSERERRLLASLRCDPQTSLLSSYALERDLDDPEVGGGGQAGPTDRLLLTINFRFLERQRAFLQTKELGAVLEAASEAVGRRLESAASLRFYRLSACKIAILLRPYDESHLDGREARLSLLGTIHSLATAATRVLGPSLPNWDDLIIIGQVFRTQDSCASLLSLSAYGELLAAKEQQAWRLVEPDDERTARLEAEINHELLRLTASDLDLRFQPILLLADPGRFGLEVLVRFRSPLLQRLGTGKVLESARQMGMAHKLDELVLSRLPEVQRQLRGSAELADRISYISFNVSSDSVSSLPRLQQLIALLQRQRLDSSLFCIEITESAATDPLAAGESVTTASERLTRELNLRVFIDDFGSGLSNYRRVSEAWYDTIKLDMELIRGIARSFRLQRYVGAFIQTVHSLGKTVVAEGVQSYGDMATAIRLGADALQGFHISRPCRWEELPQFVTRAEWGSADAIRSLIQRVRSSDHLLDASDVQGIALGHSGVPLERHILNSWAQLRSFEEFVLLFLAELKGWGLDVFRLSLVFLPDQDDIDCSQYIWRCASPGEVEVVRKDREFLAMEEHLASPLHHLATQVRMLRVQLLSEGEPSFRFLCELQREGCSDYLGIRLDSRGVSIPVLTIALRGGSRFGEEQIQRIDAMSGLLSLLFYSFEIERARQLALMDSLTGLANRRSFDSFLRANIASSRQQGSRLALALLDLDHFKALNDVLGHAYGDTCLRRVGELLSQALEGSDTFLARIGGEEFALILPGSDRQKAIRICDRLRTTIHEARILHPSSEAGGVLSISIGVAVWEPMEGDGCDWDQLLQVADECLYAAKHEGRNRVVCRRLPPERVAPTLR